MALFKILSLSQKLNNHGRGNWCSMGRYLQEWTAFEKGARRAKTALKWHANIHLSIPRGQGSQLEKCVLDHFCHQWPIFKAFWDFGGPTQGAPSGVGTIQGKFFNLFCCDLFFCCSLRTGWFCDTWPILALGLFLAEKASTLGLFGHVFFWAFFGNIAE